MIADLRDDAGVERPVGRQHLGIARIGEAQPDVAVGQLEAHVPPRHGQVVGRSQARLEARLTLQHVAIGALAARQDDVRIGRILPVAGESEAHVLDGLPHLGEVDTGAARPVRKGDVLDACRSGHELLERHA